MSDRDVLNAASIRRTHDVSESDRTPHREEAADWIESEYLDEWPVPVTELAANSEWSRQHLRNTLDAYFEPASDGNGGNDPPDAYKEGVRDGYAEGYSDGYRDGHDAATE